jgi:ribulose-phosphate 3-epimerase
MGKLAASILSADLAHLAEQVDLVHEHVDVVHVDVMDAHFVPALTIGPIVVASLRPHTDRVLYAHLMAEAPETLFDELSEVGTDVVAFHVEAVADPAPVIAKARGAGMRVGLAVSPETPIESVFPYLDEIDDVAVLSVPAGRAGHTFMPEAFAKIEAVRAELGRRGLSADVEVEGGVTLENARRCVEAGANVLVVASAVFGAPDVGSAARELKAVVEPA